MNLAYCESLENVDALAGLTNITSLDLRHCKSLKNIDGLAGLTNLTSLNLAYCESLENVDALAGRQQMAANDALVILTRPLLTGAVA